jgi:1,4-dihydroxy-2-naphthoate octaprenyltransferase
VECLRMLRRRTTIYFRAVRGPFLVASAIPVLLGTAVAYARLGRLNLPCFGMALLGCMALHAGANAANDYFDWLSGADPPRPPRPFSGGSQCLQEGSMTPRAQRRLYCSCYLLACLLGIVLAREVGPGVLLFGLIGLVFGHGYSAPPSAFSYRGWGEAVTGLTFGPLAVLGTYYVQVGALHWPPLLASIPVGLLITAVLYINEFPDWEEDARARRKTLVVRSGGRLFAAYQALVVAGLIFTAITLISLSFWLAGALLPLIWLSVTSIRQGKRCYPQPERLTPVQAKTLALHVGSGLLLTIAHLCS